MVELKFDPGFRVIGEYLSQIDLTLRVNLIQLNFLGQILVAQLFRSNFYWLHFLGQTFSDSTF